MKRMERMKRMPFGPCVPPPPDETAAQRSRAFPGGECRNPGFAEALGAARVVETTPGGMCGAALLRRNTDTPPRGERISHVLHGGSQFGVVAEQNARHIIVLDPVQAGPGVDGGRVIPGDEAVTFQPP